jgi:hypothetical protein
MRYIVEVFQLNIANTEILYKNNSLIGFLLQKLHLNPYYV